MIENKWWTLAEMIYEGGGEGGEAWTWRRRLLVWEEDQVKEWRILLDDVSLQVDIYLGYFALETRFKDMIFGASSVKFSYQSRTITLYIYVRTYLT